MTIIVHGITPSPPVRAVMLFCKAAGIDYEFKNVNLLEGEHLKPEYIKMNPLHTVPTIEDGDFTLYDSHAILMYLADKVDAASWYPKDLKKRAIVNQRLHFENGVLFTRLRGMFEPVFFGGESSFDEKLKKKLVDSLGMLETLLGDNDWLAGENPTIADISAITTVTSLVTALPDEPVPAKVAAWMKRCEETFPEFQEVNTAGVQMLGEIIKSKVKA